MKKIITLAYAVSVILAFTACSGIGLQKDEPVNSAKEEIESPKVWKASINATKGSGDAKSKALSEVGGSLNTSWEAGDVVYICDSNSDYGSLTAQSDGINTTLSGTITKTMTVGKTYTLRYLQKGQDYLYLPSQKGTLANIAKNHDMAEASVTVQSIDGENVVFNETEVNFESKVSITKFTFNRSISNVSIFSSNLKTYVRPGYSANYKFIEVKPDAETNTVYVAMSHLEDKKAVFLFLAKGADGLYYTAAKNVKLENGKYYKTNVTLQAMPDYVDLGIDRDGYSVCWATKNLGASRPGEAGNFYAWAETATKTTYSWDNYAYGSYSWVTKYDPDRPDQGIVDGLASLLPEDDAATKSLGDDWRTPSLNDFKDLLNASNTEMMLSFADGIWGYCFHSIIEGYTSKFIFMPLTGGYYKESAKTDTSYGYYWSNKIEQTSWTSASFANVLKFSKNYYSSPETGMMQRAYGLVVRPVYLK
ncbi:MAG: hypothetical protein IK041_04170 [Bacteroidales bacterium]|nr:hypothetical protein [Bacteroidales bacterium]